MNTRDYQMVQETSPENSRTKGDKTSPPDAQSAMLDFNTKCEAVRVELVSAHMLTDGD